ncbi:hypothetical protein JCM16303_007261 [Sporobolomyces ruberrimus]
MDEIEDEDEDDSRSNDASSEGGDRDEAGLARPSTSGTRTNSTSSTTNDGVAGAGAVPQKTQAAFVNKLWSMLYTPTLSHLIAWTDDGKAFTVFHPTEFARAVLPQFFKHSNFASFIRQLNMYGFGKRVNDALASSTSQPNSDGSQVQAWEFQNTAFQRDRPDLLTRIRRKSAKPSTTATASSNRRRPSVVRTASSKPRRDTTSDGGGDEEEAAPRIGTIQQSFLPTPSVLFGDGTPGPHNSSSVVKVVAGLTEFAPPSSYHDVRTQQRAKPKEEYSEAPVSRSPGSYARSHPAYPPPHPPSYYHPPSTHASPPARSQMYPLAPPPFYSSSRAPPHSEDPTLRQIASLEGQLRSFSEALFHTQQDYVASKAASYSVLGMLLGIVADLDVGDKRKEQIEACSSALSKLHPDVPGQAHLGLASQPLSSMPHLAYSYSPNSQPLVHNPTYQQYNRIPTAESYTRSSRPESAQAVDAKPSLPPPASNPPPAFRPSSTPQSLGRPRSPMRPCTSSSTGAPTTSSGPPPPQTYASPRANANWPNSSAALNRPTSLPSLSSLLEGVPASGDRHSTVVDGRESEPPDERARKKMRQ